MGYSDPSAMDDLLVSAAQRGSAEECKRLLGRGANPSASKDGLSVLRIAASIAGSVDTVRVLLDAGAAPDGAVDHGSTPLQGAAYSGHLDVVRALVEAGADIHRESFGMPLTPTGTAEYWSFLGKGQAEVAAYLRSLGGQNPYNDPNRPENLWEGREGELHLRFVERALGSRVSPFPLQREHVKGRDLLLYSCRFDRKKWLFRLLFTVQLSLTAGCEVGLALPCNWPVHRAALELPRFAWPIDFLFGLAARLDRDVGVIGHGDVLDRAHPLARGLAWPARFDQWLVVQHASFETVRTELAAQDEHVAKHLRPTLLLVPHFAKTPLRPGADARAKADAKALVKWAKPALGTARNGLVVPIETSAEGSNGSLRIPRR